MTPDLVVGYGYVGRRLAVALRREGRKVDAVSRREPPEADGVHHIPVDLDDAASLSAVPTAWRRLWYLAPPPGDGATDPRLRRFLQAIPTGAEPRRIVYAGTTGVYGDCGGAWVGEDRPLRPSTDRARRRVDAERALGEWGRARGAEWVVLRVSGIYGPGRLPLEALRAGQPVLEGAEPLGNRVHVDDLVRVCLAAMERGLSGAAYNVSDGRPTTMADYFRAVARAAGLPQPPSVPTEEARRSMSPAMLSYLEESRRIDNGRMLRELGVALAHPDMEEGVRASLEEERAGLSARPRPPREG